MIGTLEKFGGQETTGRGMANILVVEDDRDLGGLFASALRLADYDVDVVTKGEAALESLAAKPYDVMVLDLHMPSAKLDGVEVLRRYRDISPLTAVIVVTGWGNLLDTGLAVDADVDRYLEKPVDVEELIAAVEPYVRRFSFAGFVIDARMRRASFRGQEIDQLLTPTEYDLLALFVRHGRLGFQDIAWLLRGEDWDRNRARSTYNAHLSRLRDKLAELTGRETIRLDPRTDRYFLLNVDEEIL